MKKIENIKTKLAVIPLVMLLYLVMYLLDTTCIIKSIIGIPCPGCGMTRALLQALRFNFAEAFKLHSMFWSLPLLGLYFLYDGAVFSNKKLNTGVLVALGIGFLANWIFHLLV